jgi:putative aldouronate transport system substrate-binding protein
VKKIISVILSALMIILIFNACGLKNSADSEIKKVENDISAKEKEEVSNFNKTGYPIVNEPVTVTVMHSQNPQNSPYEEMEYFKEMEKLTNVKLKFIPISANYAEKKGLAFASGDIPDVVIEVTDDEVYKYGTQGKLLLPLQDLINDTTPNIKKAIEEYPELLPVMTELDGNIYALAVIYLTATTSPHYVFGRTDWLKEIGEGIPETVDDFYNIAKKIQEWDSKKIPLVYPKERMSILIRYLSSAFGSSVDYRFGIDGNDKVEYVPVNDQFRDTLMFVNRLYTEKLLDNECFSQSNTEAVAKVKSNVAAIFSNGAISTLDQFPSGEYDVEIFPPLTSSANSKKHLSAPDIVGENEVVFTTKLKN